MPKKKRPRAAKRTACAGWALMAVILIASSETLATTTASILDREFVGYGTMQAQMSRAAAGVERIAGNKAAAGNMDTSDLETIHPYFGESYRAGAYRTARPYGQEQLADYGFQEDAGPLVRERLPDRFVINIVGGSVARGFLDWGGREVLTEELSRLPELEGKEIVFSTSAFYGQKEPQQLLAVNYLMTMGAQFDLIVALDGFNEITMGKVYSEPAGFSPFYPAGWFGELWNYHMDPGQTLKRAEITLLREKRVRLAETFSDLPLGGGMTAGVIWKVMDMRMERELKEKQYELATSRPADSIAELADTGPMPEYKSTRDYLDDQVSVWENATRQLARLSAANGIRFVSVLQPNQYAGSHAMTADELRYAWTEDNPFKPLVEEGYPLLREAGHRLHNEGIVFEDFSDLFDDVDETVYTDDCCHFNAPLGNELLARRLAGVIAEELARDGNNGITE